MPMNRLCSSKAATYSALTPCLITVVWSASMHIAAAAVMSSGRPFKYLGPLHPARPSLQGYILQHVFARSGTQAGLQAVLRVTAGPTTFKGATFFST
eukprot:15165868-Alexandrium_andersonii.AAC.1